MNFPENPFKRALGEGRPQIGLWVGLADAYVAEALATTGTAHFSQRSRR